MYFWKSCWVLGCAAAFLLVEAVSKTGIRTEQVCRPDKLEKQAGGLERFMVVANDVSAFLALTNCTVIEGSLRIYWMIDTKDSDFENISFPNLVEITDYLLVYRISGLVTLGSLFPNLRIIRGQHLMFTYALIVYEMENLETVGLSNLAVIQNGLVRFEKNPNLCYLDTVNWDLIVQSLPTKDNPRATFRQNKNAGQCSENCPQNCPVRVADSRGNYNDQRLCWNDNRCQTVPPDCSMCRTGCAAPNGPCCHSECIGGCTGPNATDCMACQNVFHDGACLARCPPGLYKLSSRRCITEKSCRELDVFARPRLWWKTHNDSCIHTCPTGFTDNTVDKHLCEPCNGSCIKVCTGRSIETVPQSAKFKGCTKVTGFLEIRIIASTRNIHELEENLGEITEVTQYVKIVRSHDLTSLNFLRKLSRINGDRLDRDKFALHILDNPNLESLWDLGPKQNLTVFKGTFFIHMNRKLCLKNIDNLIRRTNFTQDLVITELEVSRATNGHFGDCHDQVLNVSVEKQHTSSYEVQWTTYNSSDTDPRGVIGYGIKYKQVAEGEVVTYRNEGQDMWTVVDSFLERDSPPSQTREEFIYVQPFVRYALFVTTYMASLISAGAGGRSPIIYFRTQPDHPYPPTDVTVKAESLYGSRSLHVSWLPPKKPNGIVTEYWVYYRKQRNKPIKNRDYCASRGSWVVPKPFQSDSVTIQQSHGVTVNQTSPNGSCPCNCIPKVKPLPTESTDQVEMELVLSYAVENLLHDMIFHKTPPEVGKTNSDKRRRNAPSVTADEMLGKKLAPSGSEDVPKLTVVKNETSVYLFDLEPARYYSVEVIACHDYDEEKGNRLCSARAMSGGSTLPDGLLDYIKNESFVLVAPTIATGGGSSYLVKLMWDEPSEFNETNGQILAYEIEMKEIIDGKEEVRGTMCINQTTFHGNNGSYSKEVKPGEYSFRVRLISSLGAQPGDWTPSRTFVGRGTSEDLWKPWVIGVVATSTIILISVIISVGYFVYSKKKAASQIPRDILYASMNPDYWDANEVYMPDEWEVSRANIKLLRELGQGSFGMVYEGIASGLHTIPDVADVHVAVKTVNENSSLRDRISFLKEASVMKAFNCPHIVKLLGVVSQGQPTLVVMELMANGDLKNYLRQHRPDEPDNNGRQPPTIKQIWRMAAEIADGMSYLAAKKFVHRDLAARNCMVAEDTTVKIGDFGMTRDIYETDYYRKGSKGLLPVRWMAPESLKDGVFTSYSDVWSYGVVMWEMATLAAQPYQGLSNEQVLKYVVDANMMEAPEGCPEKLFQLMLKCWQYRPKSRLSFGAILEHLKNDLHVEMSNNFWYFEKGQTSHLNEEERFSDGDHEDVCSAKNDTEACAYEHEPLRYVSAIAKKTTSQLLTSGYSSLPRTGSATGYSSLAGAVGEQVANGHVHLPLLGDAAHVASDSDDGDEDGCSASCESSASVYDEMECGSAARAENTPVHMECGALLDLVQPWPPSHNHSSLPGYRDAKSVLSAAVGTAQKDDGTTEGFIEDASAGLPGKPCTAQPSNAPLKFSCPGSSKDGSSQSHTGSKSSCNGSTNGHVTYMPRAAEC